MMRKPMRALIVDDQPRARNSLRALLTTWRQVGEVYEATDGREAIRLVEELHPNIVLMDARMPEMDGLKATVQIKATRPEVKVIILSMYVEYRDEALSAGADAFVAKADAPGGLLAVLVTVMEEV